MRLDNALGALGYRQCRVVSREARRPGTGAPAQVIDGRKAWRERAVAPSVAFLAEPRLTIVPPKAHALCRAD